MNSYFSLNLSAFTTPIVNALFATLYAFIIQFIVSFLFITFPLQIVSVISKWHIYVKAGEAGWKSVIPFYNDYILYKIIWGNARMLLLPLGCVLFFVVYLFSRDILWIFISFTLFISSLCGAVVTHLKLAKVFEKKTGFGFGLVLMPFVFLPILAFGKSKYTRNDDILSLKLNSKL